MKPRGKLARARVGRLPRRCERLLSRAETPARRRRHGDRCRKRARELADLMERVERGEVVTITREGRPVATLSPVSKNLDEDGIRRAFDKIKVVSCPQLTDDELVECIRADRRY